MNVAHLLITIVMGNKNLTKIIIAQKLTVALPKHFAREANIAINRSKRTQIGVCITQAKTKIKSNEYIQFNL